MAGKILLKQLKPIICTDTTFIQTGLQVTVEDPKTGKAVNFSCQRWFSTSEDDGKISRELSRDDQVEETIADKGE